MLIRPAVRDDVNAVLEISNWAAHHTAANFAIEPESLESWLESFDETNLMYPWLVATDDSHQSQAATDHPGDVIGFAKASPHRGRCAYAWTAEVSVYVHPDHHGQGVGSSLYSKLIPILKAQGYITLIAGITTPNPASEKLHESCGFKRIGAFHRVGWKFNRWHDVSYWETFLRDGADPPEKIRSVAEVIDAFISAPAER